jgi:hypothetical protein
MKYISHRGNLTQPRSQIKVVDKEHINNWYVEGENSPNLIEAALELGFDVEVDVWQSQYNKELELLLGHDFGTYPIEMSFFEKHKSKLWIHCKNFGAVKAFENTDYNYFWHDKDLMTLTSKGWIWTADPTLVSPSVVFMDTLSDKDRLIRLNKEIYAVCSDYIQDIRDLNEPKVSP